MVQVFRITSVQLEDRIRLDRKVCYLTGKTKGSEGIRQNERKRYSWVTSGQRSETSKTFPFLLKDILGRFLPKKGLFSDKQKRSEKVIE